MSQPPDAGLGTDPDAQVVTHTQLDDRQFFVFRVGQTLIGVPPANVDRVVSTLRPVRIPTAAAHILGIAHLQGRIITIIGLHHILSPGAAPTQTTSESRTLVLRATDGVFATEVQQVLGLQSTRSTGVREPERTESALQSAVYSGEYDADDGIVTVLDVDELFRVLSGS